MGIFDINWIDAWDPDDDWGEVAGEGVATGVGALAGGALGSKIGATTGSAIAPGIGTVVGGALGLGIGIVASGMLGNGNHYYTIGDAGHSGLKSGHSYVKYKTTKNHSVDHLMWDKDTGELFYLDPDSNSYIKSANTANTFGGYASDKDLTTAADAIESTLASNKLAKLQAEQNAAAQAAYSSGVFNIPVPTATSVDSIQAQEYNKRKLEADLLLQKMMTSDTEATKNEDNTVYYKYGPDEIDLKYYLHNLGTNLQKYIDSLDWSQALKNAFTEAYNNYKTGLTEQLNNKSSRFSTDDAGNLLDSENLLGSNNIVIDENGLIYNSIDEIPDKKLRKTAIEFSPNQEVLNYLNAIGLAVVGAGKTRKLISNDSGDFDLNKHGFIRYWADKINPAGGNPDIDTYLALDPVNPAGKRERTNRTKYLVHELTNYLNRIKNGNYSFENTTFKNKNTYIVKIQEAINNLNNGWDTTDPASLQAIGITPDFYSAFMTDVANPLMSEAEISAEQQKRKDQAASDFIDTIEQQYNRFASSGHAITENNAIVIPLDSRYNVDSLGFELRLGQAILALLYPYDANNIGISAETIFNSIKASVRAGEKTINTPAGVKQISEILPIFIPLLEKLGKIKTSASGVKYIDDPEDARLGAVLCIDNGRLYYKFLEEVKESEGWLRLKALFNKSYTGTTDKPKHSFDKLGGVLKKLEGGGAIGQEDFDPETLAALLALASGETPQLEDTPTILEGTSLGEAVTQLVYGKRQAAAKAKGMSYNQYNLKQRTPNGSPDFYNDNNGQWKTEDYVRLGAIAADIASMPLPGPIGAAVGFGGTMANLWADWADNSVTTGELFKNLGANLGMDLLSIIPIVGDAADAGRLAKNLGKMAPKIGYMLSAYGILATLKNGQNIMESLSKVNSDEKLTVGDYQNIAQAIAALAGINGGIKAGVAQKLAKKKAIKNNDTNGHAIGLALKKNGGEAQDFIFEGSKAKEIRDLIKNGKVEDVNAYIKKLEGFSDYEVNTFLTPGSVSTQLPIGRTTNADGTKSWGVKSPLNVERKIDYFDIYDPKKLRGGYASANMLSTGRLDAVTGTNRHYTDDSLKTREEIQLLALNEFNTLHNSELEAAKKTTERINKELELKTTSLKGSADDNGVRTGGLEAKLAANKTKLEELNTQLAILQKRVLEARKKSKNNRYQKDGEDLSSSEVTQKRKTIQEEIQEIKDRNKRKQEIEEELISLRKNGGSKETIAARSKRKAELDLELKEIKAAEQSQTKSLEELEAKAEAYKLWDDLYGESWFKKEKESYDVAKKQLALFMADLIDYDPQLARLKAELERHTRGSQTFRASKPTKNIEDLIATYLNYEYAPGKTLDLSLYLKNEILEKYKLLKLGGRLQFLKEGNVLKALHGVTLNPNRNWYNDIFSNYRQFLLDKIKESNGLYATTINEKQKEHSALYKAANASNKRWLTDLVYIGADNSVGNYLDWYHNEGLNNLGIAPNYNSRYKFTAKTPTSGDNPGKFNSNYKADNYYSSITDDRRVLGRRGKDYDDWTEEQRNSFNSELAKYKLKMDVGDDGYYYIKPLNNPSNDPETPVNPVVPPVTDPTPQYGKDPSLVTVPLKNPIPGRFSGKSGSTGNSNPSTGGFLGKLNGIAPDLLGLARLHYLNNQARKIAELSKKGEIPYLLDPVEHHRAVFGNLRAKMEGEQAAALLNSLASRPLTSDGALQTAALMEAKIKGQQYIDAGNKADDEMIRKTMEESWLLEKENKAMAHNIAMQNRLSALKTFKNRNDIDTALRSEIAKNTDTWLQELLYNAKTKQMEHDLLLDNATLSRIQAAVQNNPNKYGANLSSLELAVYNKAMAAGSALELSLSEINLLASAKTKVNAATTNQYYNYKGIGDDQWTADANKFRTAKASFTPTLTPLAKDGTKLHIAKIRNKAKNADRFLKSIQKQLDSLDKKLDRISKSMYGLPKSEVIKAK